MSYGDDDDDKSQVSDYEEHSYNCGYDHDNDECHDYDGDGYCDHDLNKNGHCPHDDYHDMDSDANIVPEDDLISLPGYPDEFYRSRRMRHMGLTGTETVTQAVYDEVCALYDEYINNPEENEGEEEERAQEEQQPQEQQNSEEVVVDGNDTSGFTVPGNTVDAQWVTEYEEKLAQYGAANNNAWQRDDTLDLNGRRPQGLKGSFANGVIVHYTEKNNLSVQSPEGQAFTADMFKEIVALAKDQEQDVKLGQSMTPEFRSALIEACAKGGVEMQNLSDEDRNLYNSFLQPAENNQEVEYEGYFNPKSARIRCNMMEKLASVPARDASFNETSDTTGLDEKIALLKKSGAVIGKDTKESAELTLAEYVRTSVASEKSPEDDALKSKLGYLEKALWCYNLEPHKEGEKIEFDYKKASERTEEEWQDMKYAVLQLQPQDKNFDKSLRNMTYSRLNRDNGYGR